MEVCVGATLRRDAFAATSASWPLVWGRRSKDRALARWRDAFVDVGVGASLRRDAFAETSAAWPLVWGRRPEDRALA